MDSSENEDFQSARNDGGGGGLIATLCYHKARNDAKRAFFTKPF
ncbi:hypothetical protein [Helicobacter sp.]